MGNITSGLLSKAPLHEVLDKCWGWFNLVCNEGFGEGLDLRGVIKVLLLLLELVEGVEECTFFLVDEVTFKSGFVLCKLTSNGEGLGGLGEWGGGTTCGLGNELAEHGKGVLKKKL